MDESSSKQAKVQNSSSRRESESLLWVEGTRNAFGVINRCSSSYLYSYVLFYFLFFLYFFYKHVTLSHSPWKNHSSISQYYKVVFCCQFTYFDFILWLTWFASLINWNIKNFHLEILCNLHNSRIIQDFWRIIRQKIVHNLLEKNA